MHIHDLVQGTDAWHQFRFTHDGASEASIVLGLSKKATRNDLLKAKQTGIAKEFSEWVQTNILDYGHEVEALARPIVENLIGEELYPVTCSVGNLSASCDGLNMSETRGWEHKQWNPTLAASVAQGVLPDEYMPQVQQCMMITGAARWTFTVSDGTSENMVSMDVYPDEDWFERIRAGWSQFAKDLETFVPAVSQPKPTGHTPETLPALHLEVTGMVKASNLAEFKSHAMAVFANINRELTTDQHFADAEKTVKWCEVVEGRLEAAKEHALSQTQSIDQLFKTIDDIKEEARNVRLELDKLVTRRKSEIRTAIVLGGKAKYDAHITALKLETDGCWISLPQPDFANAIKGKRNFDSMQDSVDTLLANAKIEADASAKSIRTNLAYIKDHAAGFEFLFADKGPLVAKKLDDLQLVVTTRIANHKKIEADRLEAERTRIQEEEKAKAEAKVRADQAAAQPVAVETVTSTAAADMQQQDLLVLGAGTVSISTTPAVTGARTVFRSASSTAPALTLGKIGTRLGFPLTADFLRKLGFDPAAKERSAVLYHESDWESICAALIRHITQAKVPQQQAA